MSKTHIQYYKLTSNPYNLKDMRVLFDQLNRYKSMVRTETDSDIKSLINEKIRRLRKTIKSTDTMKYSIQYKRNAFKSKIFHFFRDKHTNFYKDLKSTILDMRYYIQEERFIRRSPARTSRWFEYKGINKKIFTIGLVHEKKGEIMNVKMSEYIDKAFEAKLPNNEFSIGIEIEHYVSNDIIENQRDYARHIYAVNPGLLKNNIHIKGDGSLNEFSGSYGYEIAFMDSVKNFPNTLKDLCKAINSSDTESFVDSKCGLHVHLDMRGFTRRRIAVIYHNLVTFTDLFKKMQPESRRKNRYCRATKNKDLSRIGDNRYRAINAQALNEFNTIEVRIHEGTINYEEILNWCKFLLHIVSLTEKIEVPRFSLRVVESKFKMPSELIVYANQRIKKYASKKVKTKAA